MRVNSECCGSELILSRKESEEEESEEEEDDEEEEDLSLQNLHHGWLVETVE